MLIQPPIIMPKHHSTKINMTFAILNYKQKPYFTLQTNENHAATTCTTPHNHDSI